MRINKALFVLTISLIYYSFENHQTAVKSEEKLESTSSDLEVDHLNIWVSNPAAAKEQLENLGFSSVPDSISDVHDGQGTAGRKVFPLFKWLFRIDFCIQSTRIRNKLHPKQRT